MKKAGQTKPGQMRGGFAAVTKQKLDRFFLLSRVIIIFDTLRPSLVFLSSLVGIFLIYALSNLPNFIDPTIRVSALGIFGILFIVFLYKIFSIQFPNFRQTIRRIDRDSKLPHRVIQTVMDRLAQSKSMERSLHLWRRYLYGRLSALDNLALPEMNSTLPSRDRFALRYQIWTIVFALYFIHGGEIKSYLNGAFALDLSQPKNMSLTIEGWISPPSYTGIPPLMISINPSSESGDVHYLVPFNSMLTIKMGSGNVVIKKEGDENPEFRKATDLEGGNYQSVLTTHARYLFQTDDYGQMKIDVDVIPDHPPTIELAELQYFDPEKLIVSYDIFDDYSVQYGELRIAANVADRIDGANPRKGLVPEPVFKLPLPANRSEHRAELVIEASMVPPAWMGSQVSAILTVKDQAGQEGSSKEFLLTLPQRSLSSPLARALSEQSRTLLIKPDQQVDIVDTLQTILSNPSIFQIDFGHYLNLRSVTKDVRDARNDNSLLNAGFKLDQLAIAIDEFQNGNTKDELNAVLDSLRRELDRNDNTAQSRELIDQLKRALQHYLGELGSRSQSKGNLQSGGSADKGERKSLSDLLAMMDRLDRYQQSGNLEGAQQVLNELQAILDRLQPQVTDDTDGESESYSSLLDELDRLARKQKELRDEGFQRENKQNAGPKELADRQQRELSEGLQSLMEELQGLGVPNLKSLEQALESMRSAERSARTEGRAGLIEDQNKAIKELRQGKQDLSNLLRGGNKDGSMGTKRNSGNSKSPSIGRKNMESQGYPGDSLGDLGEDTIGRKDYTDSARRRSEEILNELGRKLGEPARPTHERDYFKRLLELN